MKDKLVTSSYCFILAANFLLYFGFWLLIPVLPFYLSEVFSAGNSTIGIILSCYTVAALCIRPFSGYFLDSFARKPLYLMAYFIFMTMFAVLRPTPGSFMSSSSVPGTSLLKSFTNICAMPTRCFALLLG